MPDKHRYSHIVLKAAFLKPLHLFVLGLGIFGGIVFSAALIPVGIAAYGVLCYLDLSNEEFIHHILRRQNSRQQQVSEKNVSAVSASAAQYSVHELQQLGKNIEAVRDKIAQVYAHSDEFTRTLLGDFATIESLVTQSLSFLAKAQAIRAYLVSEDVNQSRQDVKTLQQKVENARDEFSLRQYQNALDARKSHLHTLYELQQLEDRLVAQVTNISRSLESFYSRMVKLCTLEAALASAESEHIARQLDELLTDLELFDQAISEHTFLPEEKSARQK